MQVTTLFRLFVASEMLGAVIVVALLVAGPTGSASAPETPLLPVASAGFGSGQPPGGGGGGGGPSSSPTPDSTSVVPARIPPTPISQPDQPSTDSTPETQSNSLTQPSLTTPTPTTRTSSASGSPSPEAGVA